MLSVEPRIHEVQGKQGSSAALHITKRNKKIGR